LISFIILSLLGFLLPFQVKAYPELKNGDIVEDSVKFQESKYYQFRADAGQKVEIIITCLNDLTDITVTVYDEEWDYISSKWLSIGEERTGSIIFKAAKTGIYYIEVYGSNLGDMFHGTGNQYRLKLVIEGEPPLGKTLGVIMVNMEAFSDAVDFLHKNYGVTLIQPPYPEKIGDFSAIVIFYAGYGDEESYFAKNFDAKTVQSLIEFARNGGGILIEQSGWKQDNLAALLSNFGIVVTSNINHETGKPDDNEIFWVDHPIFDDIHRLSGYFGNPLYQNAQGDAEELAYTFGKHAFIVSYQNKGRIVSITGSIHQYVKGYFINENYFVKADNALLLKNIIDWLLKKEFPQRPPVNEIREEWHILQVNEFPELVQSPLVDEDGRLFYVSNNWIIAKNITTDVELWRYDAGGFFEPKIALSSKMLIANCEGRAVALDTKTGAKIWEFTTKSYEPLLTPVIGYEKVFLESRGVLYVLNLHTGKLLWKFDMGTHLDMLPIVANNLVFIYPTSGFLFGLNISTGFVKWFKKVSYEQYYTPKLLENENRIIICSRQNLYIFVQENGSLTFNYNFSTEIKDAVVKGADIFVKLINGDTYLVSKSKTPPQIPTHTFNVDILRTQFFSKNKGKIIDVKFSDITLESSDHLIVTLEITNLRGAMYTIDVYNGPIYTYQKTLFLDENGGTQLVHSIHQYDNVPGFYFELDVNVGVHVYLLGYVFDNILGFSPTPDTLWQITKAIKDRYFPEKPFLDLYDFPSGWESWVSAIANYMKENPEVFVQIAAECGVSYTINKILEKASIVLSATSSILNSVDLIVKSLTCPAEETLHIAIKSTTQVMSVGSALVLQESSHKLYLHIYDSQNRHVGINQNTKEIDLEIPGTTYFDYGGRIIIILPNSTTKFKTVVDATFANETHEAYNLTIATFKSGEIVDQQVINASIKQDEKVEYQIDISSDGKLSVTPLILQPLQLYLYVGVFVIIVLIVGIVYVIKVRKKSHSTSLTSNI
jgi:outer membrane protein assembly factor BamB